MTTIWERVDTVLATLEVPYAVSTFQVSKGEDFPDVYMEFFMVDMTPEQHGDDEELERSELVQVNVYQRVTLIGLPDVIGAMTAAGFTFAGGRQLDKDEDTGHYAISYDFEYLEDL